MTDTTPAHMKKGFSKKHETAEAHNESKARRVANEQAQFEDMLERDRAARARSPREQIARLDSLLGKNKGAAKERKRLQARL